MHPIQMTMAPIKRPPAKDLAVDQALDDYWREHASRCADPVRQENAIRHLKSFFGDMPLDDIDIPKGRAYAEARRAGVIGGGRRTKSPEGSDSTIRRELNVLIAASNHAKKWRRTVVGVSIELPTERRLGQDDQAPYFSKAEVETLLMMADGDLHHFIALAYYTGARRASIEDLTRSQVKWDQKRILLMKPGKVATKKRQPIVPILPEMEAALQALFAHGHERLFATTDFYRPFRRLCHELGFGERDNPHLLRHSRATHLLQAGVSLYTVARLLGDTFKTVESVYGHHSHEHVAEEIMGVGR